MKNYKQIGLILTILNAFSMYSGETFSHPNLLMPPNYNINKAPIISQNEPIIIGFNINLRNILEVNEITQLLTLETDIRMLWKDSRLEVDLKNETLDFVYLNPVETKHFWIPDIYIDKAKDIRIPAYHNIPASLRIYPDQHLRYSGRINFDVACPMDFHRYPMDEQMCEILFESFGYTSNQLKIEWDSRSTINPNITLPQFTVNASLVDTHTTDYYELAYPGMFLSC
jgi:hypothetical protein